MKKIAISTGIILFISAIIYTNNRYGLLSMAGLNGKGLAAKEVRGNLKSSPSSSSIKIDYSDKLPSTLEWYTQNRLNVIFMKAFRSFRISNSGNFFKKNSLR